MAFAGFDPNLASILMRFLGQNMPQAGEPSAPPGARERLQNTGQPPGTSERLVGGQPMALGYEGALNPSMDDLEKGQPPSAEFADPFKKLIEPLEGMPQLPVPASAFVPAAMMPPKTQNNGQGRGTAATASDGSSQSARPRPRPPAKERPTAKPKSDFRSAFAEARRAGLAEFEWNGERYSTVTREEIDAAMGTNATLTDYLNQRRKGNG